LPCEERDLTPLQLPVIDVSALTAAKSAPDDRLAVAAQLKEACCQLGFFYVVGHGIDEGLQAQLAVLCEQFFAQDQASKMAIHMPLGGPAWRGYFPLGEELTSGKPDRKEGLYFGQELPDSHPRVHAGVPLHGRNLFPKSVPALRECVLSYMQAMTQLGHTLVSGIALSLGLPASYFADRYTADPLTLFRVFHYPPVPLSQTDGWGVGEHTDYGLLTILKQDSTPGLQIKSRSRWLAAPPVAGSFVCNLGDMLERMTGGLYRSTPHRVQNTSGRSRLSFPFFFDPSWEAKVAPIALPQSCTPLAQDASERWDRASVHAFAGTYGDYVLAKVGRVFPGLLQRVL
jgi:isopenicillin N synthase-like dioxygenase